MKTILIGAASLAITASAMGAETTVTLYGIGDANVRFDHTNIGTLKSIGSGGESGSRWGLRGNEDLGNGLVASFIFEQGFDLGDNASVQGNVGAGASTGFGGSSTAVHSSTGGRLFGRIATVGLGTPYGQVRFGRDYNPLHLTQGLADPFGTGMIATAMNVFTNNTVRNDNAVYYDSQSLAGLVVSGNVQLGESTTDNRQIAATGQAKHGNDRYGASLRYTNGPIYAGVGFEQIRSNLDVYRIRSYDLAGTYDFGLIKLHAILWRTNDGNPNTTAAFGSTVQVHQQTYYGGATVPFGAWTFLAGYGYLRDASRNNLQTVNLGSPRVNYTGLGVRYSLSKRTVLYASAAHFNLTKGPSGNAFQGLRGFIDASNVGLYTTANLTSPTGASNVNPTSLQFGIRQIF